MSLTGNACVRTGCRISQSLLVVPFIRFPAVTLVALVLLIGSGCTLQPQRGKQVLNPKIPAEISTPVAEAASPGEQEEQGEDVATSEPAVPEGEGGAEEASRGEVAEEPEGSPGKQGEPPSVLTTDPVAPKTKQAVSAGVASGGAVFASLTSSGSLPVALAASAGEKAGGLDPGFSEAAEASEGSLETDSEGSLETDEVSIPAPAESPAGAGGLIKAIVAPGLLIAQVTEGKPEKGQDEAASKPATEEPSEKTGTDGSSAGAGDGADHAGNESERSDTVKASPADQTPPAAPTGLEVETASGKVTISWKEKEGDGADSYTIHRADKDDPIATEVTRLTYLDSDVENGVTYTYQVTAVDQADNESEPSRTIDATPVDPIPAAPTRVEATIGDGEITISWQGSDGADSYAVYRNEVLIAEHIRKTSYRDTDVANGVDYTYQVTAVRGGKSKSNPLPMGMLYVLGACIALALFKNSFGKRI